MELEEATLRKILAEERGIAEQIASLDEEAARNRPQPAASDSFTGAYLAAVAEYGLYLDQRRIQMIAEQSQCKARVSAQWQRLLEARRRLRLLETLEQNQRAQWRAAADRELEDLSAELYLARWKRRTGSA